MPGPGIYLSDPTEGITCPEDLPAPRVIERSRNYPSRPCPECGRSAGRLRTAGRTLHDLGDRLAGPLGRPRDLHFTYSQHHCRHCGHYFNADMTDVAAPNSHYTHRVVAAGEKKGGTGSSGSTWSTPSPTSAAISPLTSCTTARSAC